MIPNGMLIGEVDYEFGMSKISIYYVTRIFNRCKTNCYADSFFRISGKELAK